MRQLRRIHLYTIGAALLGALIVPLDQAIDSTFWFLGLTITYVILLRLVVDKYGAP